jgi:hypothetical protein
VLDSPEQPCGHGFLRFHDMAFARHYPFRDGALDRAAKIEDLFKDDDITHSAA